MILTQRGNLEFLELGYLICRQATPAPTESQNHDSKSLVTCLDPLSQMTVATLEPGSRYNATQMAPTTLIAELEPTHRPSN